MVTIGLLLVGGAPATQAAAARETIGVFKGWGAFRDTTPPRCYAITRPVMAGGRAGGAASVATWPGRNLVSSADIELSRARDPSVPVTATIGERRFALVGRGTHAFAADAPSDRALVAAIRSGRSMSVEAVGDNGRPFADVYALAGAATAIDAAALACAGR